MNVHPSKWLPAAALAAFAMAQPAAAEKKINHVFVIVLENEGYATTFGANSPAPYLSKTLPAQGVLLTQYYGTGHASLDNYIAMISGQAADNETRGDCPSYTNFTQTGITPDGQAIGSGCIYPSSVKTVADQLTARGNSWRAYMGDMGNDPNREAATCGHPSIGSVDMTQTATVTDNYATRHNPFMYFHSIIDSSDCSVNVVNLNQLTTDLKAEYSTPEFSFITPSLCDDGHDAPCKDGRPGGLVSADAFLQQWVPTITHSPAFQKDGLLMIIFDEGGFNATVPDGKGGYIISADGQFCCNEQPGPNLGKFPQSSVISIYTLSYNSYGGDRTGAVLLSPFIPGGTVSNVPFNHYSLLKTVEDIFGLDYLGYAGAPGLLPILGCAQSDVTNWTQKQFGKCEVGK